MSVCELFEYEGRGSGLAIKWVGMAHPTKGWFFRHVHGSITQEQGVAEPAPQRAVSCRAHQSPGRSGEVYERHDQSLWVAEGAPQKGERWRQDQEGGSEGRRGSSSGSSTSSR